MTRKNQSTKFPHSYSVIREHDVDINSIPLQLCHGGALLSSPILNEMLLFSVGELLCPPWLWWAPYQTHKNHLSEALWK